MKSKEPIKHLNYISLTDELCKLGPDKEYLCRVKPDNTNELIQVDYGHLSKEGSLFVVNGIIKDHLLKLYDQAQ